MTESRGLPEVQHESTVWLFRGSPWTFTEVNILLISCYPQHWPSPMSWSALTLLEVRCDLLKQSRLTLSKVSRKSMTESGGLPEVQLESTVSFSRFSPDILRAQNGLMLSLALIFSDVLIGKDLLRQSLLTFFRVNRESRRNRTNEIRRSERSCRGQAWEHRVTFRDVLTFSDILIGIDFVRCKM